MFESIWDKCAFDFERLLQFGFIKIDKSYTYSRKILQGAFDMKISINEKGKVDWEVWDNEMGEIYPLVKISGVSGAFVGKVRMACEEVLQEIVERCGHTDVFKSEQARLIKHYVRDKYGDEFEYLWEKFPDNAVFRRMDNKKWYGAVLTVGKERIGICGEGKIEVIDLRGNPEEIAQIVDGEKYFPAYHMNKKNWLTICLDGTVEIEEIYRRIDESYILAKK